MFKLSKLFLKNVNDEVEFQVLIKLSFKGRSGLSNIDHVQMQ